MLHTSSIREFYDALSDHGKENQKNPCGGAIVEKNVELLKHH
jgi:hypothetical protein